MAYIFLDESGQFNKKTNERYFLIASFTVGEPKRTHKKFKSWCALKFPKAMRKQSEIKFSDSGIDKNLKLRTLRQIAKMDVRIFYTYLDCQNIPLEFRGKKSLKSGLLYTQLVGETLDLYLPLQESLLHIFCDQRRLKGVGKQEFIDNLTARLLPNLVKGAQVRIQTVDSKQYPNIQIVDWLAGAIAAYLNKKESGDEFYGILKNNIVAEKELFKDYWISNRKKQKTQSDD